MGNQSAEVFNVLLHQLLDRQYLRFLDGPSLNQLYKAVYISLYVFIPYLLCLHMWAQYYCRHFTRWRYCITFFMLFLVLGFFPRQYISLVLLGVKFEILLLVTTIFSALGCGRLCLLRFYALQGFDANAPSIYIETEEG